MRLLKTGIEGLDDLMNGIPEGTRIIHFGPSGSGKTDFAMRFIWAGLQNGETDAYDTVDRPWPLLRRYFKSFGWDIEAYEEKNTVVAIQGFPHFDPHPRDPLSTTSPSRTSKS